MVGGDRLVISCEHAGNDIPVAYRRFFEQRMGLVASHRGVDRGALPQARHLARVFAAPLVISTVSRLLVDLNRSVGHRHLHHPAVLRLPVEERREILERYYYPHRARLEDTIRRLSRTYRVVHIGVHTFTPRRNGVTRRAEVGLLYDPRRRAEAHWCARWRNAFREAVPEWRIRRNYPYRGSDDGLTTALRRVFGPRRYLGLELEINQRLVGDERRVGEILTDTLGRVLHGES